MKIDNPEMPMSKNTYMEWYEEDELVRIFKEMI